MPELAGGERFKDRVVLSIWGSNHRMCWLGEFKEDALERRQARRIQMFDNLDNSCCLKSREPLVSIHQRSMHKTNAAFLFFWQAIQVQLVLRNFKRSPGHIHPENGLEL